MNGSQKKTAWLLATLNILVRVPFLFMGYGKEEDAWSNVINAKIISTTGVYEVSRLPGHPLYELLLSYLYPFAHNYWLFNGLSALASGFAVYFFYASLVKLKIETAFWLSVALSLIPVFFIAGTFTIDYNFALCFILISFYLLLCKQWVFAGLVVGVATGFRISSIGFILPWIIWMLAEKQSITNMLKLLLSALMLGALAFKLPYETYGINFLDFHKPPFPSWPNVLYKLSFGIWGVPLFLLLVTLFLINFKRLKSVVQNKKALFFISLGALLMQLLVFMRLPFKSEFFIPALPFILLFMGLIITKKQAIYIAGTAFFSCFFFGFDYADASRGAIPSPVAVNFKAGKHEVFFDIVKGPAFIDQSKRKQKSQFVKEIMVWRARQDYAYHVITGWFWAELAVKLPEESMEGFDYFSTEDELINASALGKNIYYLPNMNATNADVYGHYLADSLGQVLRPL